MHKQENDDLIGYEKLYFKLVFTDPSEQTMNEQVDPTKFPLVVKFYNSFFIFGYTDKDYVMAHRVASQDAHMYVGLPFSEEMSKLDEVPKNIVEHIKSSSFHLPLVADIRKVQIERMKRKEKEALERTSGSELIFSGKVWDTIQKRIQESKLRPLATDEDGLKRGESSNMQTSQAPSLSP